MFPVCKVEEEDWDHYDYECRGVREMNKRVADNVGRELAFSRSEWSFPNLRSISLSLSLTERHAPRAST